MKYTNNIDNYTQCARQLSNGKWVIAEPERTTGLYGFILRIKMSIACITGKAIAVTFQED